MPDRVNNLVFHNTFDDPVALSWWGLQGTVMAIIGPGEQLTVTDSILIEAGIHIRPPDAWAYTWVRTQAVQGWQPYKIKSADEVIAEIDARRQQADLPAMPSVRQQDLEVAKS